MHGKPYSPDSVRLPPVPGMDTPVPAHMLTLLLLLQLYDGDVLYLSRAGTCLSCGLLVKAGPAPIQSAGTPEGARAAATLASVGQDVHGSHTAEAAPPPAAET